MSSRNLKSLFLTLAVGCAVVVTSTADVAWAIHARCRKPVCCEPCPPPSVPTTVCLEDPCNCCTYEACVSVPACCAGQQPSVAWRRGFLGRQIASLCWECCGHQVDVVVTHHGRVIVRD